VISVEIWSDVVCPFCYLGKMNFEAALKAYKGAEKIEFAWRSFELDPNSKKSQSIKIHDLIAQKYGRSPEWAKENNQRLTEQGKTVGIAFNFDAIVPTNSFDAHRLIHLAKSEGKQNEVAALLFKAYFSEGQDVALHAALTAIGEKANLPADRVKQVLESKEFEEDVRREEAEARDLQITGVPAFVINRKYLVSGAQPVEAFLEVFEEAAKPG
jgi:predicted DsbA family dithiol-disulfide isomerase